MKKFVKVLCIVLMCVICVGSLSGCSGSQSTSTNSAGHDVTPNDVIQALKNAGFEGTYFEDSKVYIGNTGMYITDKFEFATMKDTTAYNNTIYIRNYSELEDTIPVLNAIIPLWDKSFDNYGEKTISELDYDSYFEYNSMSFDIADIRVENENYMNDINDHDEYFIEEAIKINFNIYNW